MNRWKEIWNKRENTIEISRDIFETYVGLKKADGFDVQLQEGYYEGLYAQWDEMRSFIENLLGRTPESVYEVGCGSGTNLYLFQKQCGVKKVGGLDYSNALIDIAKTVVQSDDILCEEAGNLDTAHRYEAVISDSAFQYFPDEDYGLSVLEKMLQKSEKAVVITEIHDLAKKEEHLAYRRSKVENYDEVYKGLEKTYYDREHLAGIASKAGWNCEIRTPENDAYWNNRFVFDLYLWR